MFLLVEDVPDRKNPETMLINVDNVYNISVRHCADGSKPDYEVGVYLNQDHDFVEYDHSLRFTGSYIVIYRGTQKECRDCIDRIAYSTSDLIEI